MTDAVRPDAAVVADLSRVLDALALELPEAVWKDATTRIRDLFREALRRSEQAGLTQADLDELHNIIVLTAEEERQERDALRRSEPDEALVERVARNLVKYMGFEDTYWDEMSSGAATDMREVWLADARRILATPPEGRPDER